MPTERFIYNPKAIPQNNKRWGVRLYHTIVGIQSKSVCGRLWTNDARLVISDDIPVGYFPCKQCTKSKFWRYPPGYAVTASGNDLPDLWKQVNGPAAPVRIDGLWKEIQDGSRNDGRDPPAGTAGGTGLQG